MIKSIQSFLICCLFLSSCFKDNFSLPEIESSLLIPIVYKEFNPQDIKSTSLIFNEDSTGLVSLTYGREEKIKASELLTVNETSFTIDIPSLQHILKDFQYTKFIKWEESNLSLKENTFSIEESFNLSTKFSNAEFIDGKVSLSITNSLRAAINKGSIISLKEGTSNSVLARTSIQTSLLPGEKAEIRDFLDLTNKKLTETLVVSVENISFYTHPLVINPGEGLGIEIKLSDLTLKEARLKLPSFELPKIEHLLTFNLPDKAEYTEVKLKEGFIHINLKESYNFPLYVDVIVPAAKKNNNTLLFTKQIEKHSPNIIDLSGYLLDLTEEGKYKANSLRLKFKFYSPGSKDNVILDLKQNSVQITLASIKPSYVKGYLGHHKTTLTGSLGIDYFNMVQDGELFMYNPSLKVQINNGLNLDVKINKEINNLIIDGYNQRTGSKVSIGNSLNNFIINGASTNRISTLFINKSNEAKFPDFISLLPSKIDFSIPLEINTPEVNYNQFIADTSEIKGSVELSFPLFFNSHNLTFTDTIGIDLGSKVPEENLKEGKLNFIIKNNFSLLINFQVYFLDEKYQVTDSAFTSVKNIKANNLNEYNTSTLTTTIYTTYLNKNTLEKIRSAKFIRPVFKIFSADEYKPVKVYTYNTLSLQLTGEFKTLIEEL